MIANLHRLVPHQFLRRFIAYTLVLTVVVQPYYILAARNHYTVDVVVSSYVAPMLWWAMEGFYTTSIYSSCAAWWATFCVPKFIQNYLKLHDPTSKGDRPIMSDRLSREIEYLVDVYGIDQDDVHKLKDLLIAENISPTDGSEKSL